MMHMSLRGAVPASFLIASCFLAGCVGTPGNSLVASTNSTAPEAPPKAPITGPRSGGEATPKNSLTSQAVDVSPWHDSDDHWTGPTAAGASFAGAYTRLIIKSAWKDSKSNGKDADERFKLSYDGRSAIERAIVGKEYNVVATAKMKIPNVLDISVPLAVVGHSSNSEGENWISEVYFERRDFPLFLVKRTGEASTPTVSAEIKGTSSIASKGVAAGVSALNRLASIAGATPPLITTLNKDATKEAADKIDAEISKLLSSSVTERSVWDRPLSNWLQTDADASSGGIEITFKFPDEGNWNKTRTLGSWTVTFAPPRPSIFSDWYVCAASSTQEVKKLRCSQTVADAIANVKLEVRPAEVLNYKLLSGSNNLGSVHSFIKSKEWYSAGALAMAKVDSSKPETLDATAASEFCRNAINEVTGLELAQTDAELVLWALYKAGRPEFAALGISPDCANLMNLSSMPGAL